MPVCKKCNSKFPNRVVIGGGEKNISKRKYCLSCSPFGKNNRKQLHKSTSDDTFECDTCGKTTVYDRSKNNKGSTCASCRTNKRRHDVQKKCAEYKGGKCSKCGYDNCYAALDFHHRNPSTKKFGIAGSHCRSWEIVKEELDKCDLLCANCHRELHYYENNGKQQIN